MFSISNIIDLANPGKIISETANVQQQQNSEAYSLVSASANLNYATFTTALSNKFPNNTDIATKLGINPAIAQLPSNEQIYAIRLSILENKINLLQNELNEISEASSEQLIFKKGFWGWGLVSIIVIRIVTRTTDKFLEVWLYKSFSWIENILVRAFSLFKRKH